jgi:hypothetical protein
MSIPVISHVESGQPGIPFGNTGCIEKDITGIDGMSSITVVFDSDNK